MDIHLRNEIDLDGQIEVVDQQFQVEVKEKMGISISFIVTMKLKSCHKM